MPYTANSDIYTAIHEDGIDRVIRHLMRKRPSLFHYGTENVTDSVAFTKRFSRFTGLCAKIDHAPEVLDWDNPLMTTEDPIPVLGTDGLVALDYCFQVVDLDVDFAPADIDDAPVEVASHDVSTASELPGAVDEQQFGARVTVCAGLACPDDDEYGRVRDRLADLRDAHGDELKKDSLREELGLPIIPTATDLSCFCLGVAVVGSVDMRGPTVPGEVLVREDDDTGMRVEIAGTPELVVEDIVLYEPGGGEFSFPGGFTASLTCYLRSFVEFALVPALETALERIVIGLPTDSLIALDLAGTSLGVSFPTGPPANNPAVEEDEFRVYTDVDVAGPGGAP